MATNQSGAVAVPMTSYWWRWPKCTLEEGRGRWAGEYIFRFHGERKEYQPGMDALEAALNLKLDENKPSPDVMKFINDYGPLNILREYEVFVTSIVTSKELALSALGGIRISRERGEEYDFKEEEAMMQSSLKKAKEMVAEGPFERWPVSYYALRELQHIYLEWKASDDLRGLAEPLQRLQPCLVEHEEGIVWEFRFTTLLDDLIGLLAQSIVKGLSWKTCSNPQCRKEFISSKLTYCNDLCRVAFHDNKTKTEFGKLRKSLSMTLKRRHDDGLINDATFEKVRNQLRKAKTEEKLRDIKSANAKIFARIPYGTTTKGGPKQYLD